jgi:hypothetical protein
MSNIDETISSLWDAIDASDRGLLTISEVVAESDRENQTLPDRLQDWILVFDQFANWFNSLATLAFLAPLILEKPVTDISERAFIPLLGSITSQLVALRRLVLAGLDMSAKQICRCLVEHVDLGVRMTLDKHALQAFLAHPEIEGAHKFWRFTRRKQTKGGGYTHLRDSLFAAMKRLGFPDESIRELQGNREEEEAILNACVHPSFIACQMAASFHPSTADSKIRWFPFFGMVNNFSVRTLQYAVIAMLDYVLYGWVPDYGERVDDLLEDPLARASLGHVRAGRDVLPQLAKQVMQKWHSGEL